MSALSDGGWTLGGGLHEADEGDGNLIPVETAVVGKVPIVCIIIGSIVTGVTPPVPE